MKPKIAYVFSTRTSVLPDHSVDGPNTIGGLMLNEVMKRGYETYTFASKLHGVSTTQLLSSKLKPFFEDFDIDEWSVLDDWTKVYLVSAYDNELLLQLKEQIKHINPDIVHIHAHSFYTTLPFLAELNKPLVFTIHNPVIPAHKKLFEKYLAIYPQLKNSTFVAISQNQSKDLSGLNTVVIPHGIDLSESPFVADVDEYITFAGRLSTNKGPHTAIKIAAELHKQFIFTGRRSTSDAEFFERELSPYINNSSIIFNEKAGRPDILKMFSKAKMFLFPLEWEEPFGLVMAESMAAGTPVVAYARGSVQELIKDGETGFIINPSEDDIRGDFIIKKTGIDGLREAVNRIYSLSPDEYKQMRLNCRTHIEKNFSVQRMVDDYEKLYAELTESNKKI